MSNTQRCTTNCCHRHLWSVHVFVLQLHDWKERLFQIYRLLPQPKSLPQYACKGSTLYQSRLTCSTLYGCFRWRNSSELRYAKPLPFVTKSPLHALSWCSSTLVWMKLCLVLKVCVKHCMQQWSIMSKCSLLNSVFCWSVSCLYSTVLGLDSRRSRPTEVQCLLVYTCAYCRPMLRMLRCTAGWSAEGAFAVWWCNSLCTPCGWWS